VWSSSENLQLRIVLWYTFALAFPNYTTHPVPCNDQPGYGYGEPG